MTVLPENILHVFNSETFQSLTQNLATENSTELITLLLCKYNIFDNISILYIFDKDGNIVFQIGKSHMQSVPNILKLWAQVPNKTKDFKQIVYGLFANDRYAFETTLPNLPMVDPGVFIAAYDVINVNVTAERGTFAPGYLLFSMFSGGGNGYPAVTGGGGQGGCVFSGKLPVYYKYNNPTYGDLVYVFYSFNMTTNDNGDIASITTYNGYDETGTVMDSRTLQVNLGRGSDGTIDAGGKDAQVYLFYDLHAPDNEVLLNLIPGGFGGNPGSGGASSSFTAGGCGSLQGVPVPIKNQGRIFGSSISDNGVWVDYLTNTGGYSDNFSGPVVTYAPAKGYGAGGVAAPDGLNVGGSCGVTIYYVPGRNN